MMKGLMLIGGAHHDFESCARLVADYIHQSQKIEITTTSDREALCALDGFDIVFLYTEGGTLSREQEDGLCGFVRNGGGLVGIHSATASFRDNAEYMEMIGSRFIQHGPPHEIHVRLATQDHVVTRGVPESFTVFDEFYQLAPTAKTGVEVLATGYFQGEDRPLAYVRDYGAGRVFYLALGHTKETFANPVFQQLIFRGAMHVTRHQVPKEVRVGIVGYGAAFGMGHHHASAVNAIPGMRTVAICDTDPSRTAQAANDFPGIQTYNRTAQMAADGDVDLVFVVLPHHLHASVAIEMLDGGKHVVSEKPMCITLDEANQMIDAAHRNQRLLTVFHNRRWDSDFLTIQNVIRSGMIGEVFHIETFMGGFHHPGTWWRSDKTISGGAAHDWGAHFWDWILALMPEPIAHVYGTVHNVVWHDVSNEDHVRIQVRFQSGHEAEFQVSSIAAASKSKWFILGTKGAVTGGWDQIHVHAHTAAGKVDGQIELVKPGPNPFHVNLANHLFFGEPLVVTAEDARRVIAVIDTGYRSAVEGKPLPLSLDAE